MFENKVDNVPLNNAFHIVIHATGYIIIKINSAEKESTYIIILLASVLFKDIWN